MAPRLARAGWRRGGGGPEAAGLALLLAAGLAAGWAFPDSLGLLTRIIVLAFLVLSLDLVTGICGIATLGQAALFGAGAYAAGLAAVAGVTEPFSLIAIGAAAGGVAGLVCGAILLRASGLPQLVLSIAIVQLLHEAANKGASVTGGEDGLSGISPDPVLGLFSFDLSGRTAYLLSLGALVICFAILRAIVRSPFGVLCRAIRADPIRVEAMGAAVYPALLKMYLIAGIVAGIGGALAAITTQVVGLDSVSFLLSADALVMLMFGGAGNLYGAVIGTVVFLVFQNIVSAANPFHWLTLVGALLIGVVLVAPQGLIGLPTWLASRLTWPRAGKRP